MDDPNLVKGSADIEDQIPIDRAIQLIKDADKDYVVSYSLGSIEIRALGRRLTELYVARHGFIDPKALEAALVVAALRMKEIIIEK
jgi:hypothetical protein